MFGDLTTEGKNQGTLKIQKNVSFNNIGKNNKKLKEIKFISDSSLGLNGNVWLKEGITTENSGQGTLNIQGDTNIYAGIGTKKKNLKEIKFDGDHTLGLNGNVYLKEGIKAKNDGEGTVILKNFTGAFYNNLIQGKHRLKSLQFLSPQFFKNNNFNITLKSNVKANEIKLLGQGLNLIVNENTNYTGKITGCGNVTFQKENKVKNLGSKDIKLNNIIVAGVNVSFNGSVNAKTLTFEEHGNAIVASKAFHVEKVTLGKGATITFKNKVNATPIETQNSGQGTVVLIGSGDVEKIGSSEAPVGLVEFQSSNNATRNLKDSIYATKIKFPVTGSLTLIKSANNITINGQIEGGNIPSGWEELGDNNVLKAVTVNTNPGSTNTLESSSNTDPGSTPESPSNSSFYTTQGQDQGYQANVNTNTPGNSNTTQGQDQESQATTFSDLLNTPNGLTPGESSFYTHQLNEITTLDQAETFTKTLESQMETKKPTDEDMAQIEAAFNDKLAKMLSKEQQKARYIANKIASESQSNNEKIKINSSLQEVSKQLAASQAVTTTINNNRINIPNQLVASAAGDDDVAIVKGAWISGIYGTSKQGSLNEDSSGYNSRLAGGIIGLDFDINDNTMLGFSYSRVNSNTKFKDGLSGNKITANSNVVSLYGKQSLTDNLSLNAIFSLAKNSINAKRSVQSTSSTKTASSKINSSSYNAEVIASYNLIGKKLVVTPNFGMKYAYNANGAYKESGVGIHNLEVGKGSSVDLSAIFGTKIAMPKKLSDSTKLVPSISMSVEKKIRVKTPSTIKAKFGWMDDYIDSEPNLQGTTDASGNVGFGMMIEHKNIELNSVYNMHFKEKYVGHQGSLQLKVQF